MGFALERVSRKEGPLSRGGSRLTVGPRQDHFERDADRFADAIMGRGALRSLDGGAPVQAQRKCSQCEEEDERLLQRRATGEGSRCAPALAEEVLSSPGQPLDADVRELMSARTGHDFSRIRIHTGETAAGAARAVSAEAFTVGEHIVFGQGMYRPETRSGRWLIAHEAAHSVQQRSGAAAGRLQRRTVCDDDGVCWSEPDEELNYTPDIRESSYTRVPSRSAPSAAAGRVPLLEVAPPLGGGAALAGAAPVLAPRVVPPVGPVRPPLRLVPPPAPGAGTVASRLPWLVRWGGPIVVGLGILLTPSETAPPWMDELNPITGGPYRSPEEYDRVRRLSQEELRREIEASRRQRQQRQTAPEPGPTALPEPELEPQRQRDPREECRSWNPSAVNCEDGASDAESRVRRFLEEQGYANMARLSCSQHSTFTERDNIQACDGAPGMTYHCIPDGHRDRTVSLFGCLCCDAEGRTSHTWRRPHWSINLSRRGR